MKRPLILAISLLISTTLHADPSIPPKVVEETTQLIKELVAIDTSNPPGNELKVAEYVKPLLEGEGIEVKIFETAPGRANLWARIRGSGKKKPLMIMAHIDVVGASKGDWKSDPFRPVEKGGFLYGRGVVDDKGMAAAAITVMKMLAQNRTPLERDVILFLGADEESGGKHGMDWMLKNHPDLVTAEVVINEGGRIFTEDGRITQAAIQNYEKLYMDVALRTDGTSGHSSVPDQDSAIARLAVAISRIGEYEFPVRLNEVTKAYFEGLSRLKSYPLRKEFLILLQGEVEGAAYQKALQKISGNPIYNAYLRTTCTPTVVKAGFRNNAIPGKAEANINCRILPTEDPKEVVKQLKRIVNDPKVKILPGEPDRPALSPMTDPFFEVVAEVIRGMAPEAVTVPFMSAGATDSAKLRYRGMKAYGILPFPLIPEDATRMHGNDERLQLKSIGFGVELLYRVTAKFAGKF